MRTFVATYKLYNKDSKNDFNIKANKNIKYQFVEKENEDYSLCYLTIIGNNRLHIRKLKKEGLNNLKKIGKVELIVSVG